MIEINQDVIKQRLNTISQQLEEADRDLVEIRKQVGSVIRETVGEILEESRERLVETVGEKLEEPMLRRVEKKVAEFLRNLSIGITVL